MGKSGISISNAPEGMPRPSLLSAGASATGHNILDAMPSRDTPSGPAPKPRWLAWLLIPLLAATAWGVSTQLQKPPLIRPVAPNSAAVAVPAAPQAVVAAVPIAPPSPDASTAATVASESTATNPFNALPATAGSTPPQNSAKPQVQEPTAFDLQAALNAPSPPNQPGGKPQTGSEPAKVAATRQTEPNKTPKTAAVGAPPKPAVAKAKGPMERSTEPKPDETKSVASKTVPSPTRKTAAQDPDVELLSAIMKHLGQENGTSEASARSSQTIAELVKSCKRKDAIEALLCQRRICEGSWGKAQACPQNLAPKSATGRNTAKAPA